jgi:hypothetical protein
VIKKILTDNKKTWHIHLKYALWANRISTKREIGMSHFQMVYGIDVILPINLALPVMKIWQDSNEEPNDITRRENQLVEVQKNRTEVNKKLQRYQDKMKTLFDQKAKDRDLFPGDLVLKWEARREDTSKHDKFDSIWSGPYRVLTSKGGNAFSLENLNGDILSATVNRQYLKHFMQ